MAEETSVCDRRTVLENIGVAASAVVGVAGIATAGSNPGTDEECLISCEQLDTRCVEDGEVKWVYEVTHCCSNDDGTYDCYTYETCGCPSSDY